MSLEATALTPLATQDAGAGTARGPPASTLDSTFTDTGSAGSGPSVADGAEAAAESGAPQGERQPISRERLDAAIAQALAEWQEAWPAADTVSVTLQGRLLSQTLDTVITIDATAAGLDWSVLEPGSPASRVDLPTVLRDELGHIRGFDESGTGMIRETLAVNDAHSERASDAADDDAGWTIALDASPEFAPGAQPPPAVRLGITGEDATIGSSAGSGSGAGAQAGSIGDVTAAIDPGSSSALEQALAAAFPTDRAGETHARGPPPPGSVFISASEGGSVTSGLARLTFAPGSLPSDAYVLLTASTAPVAGLTATSAVYDLLAWDAQTGAPIETFPIAPRLTIAGVGSRSAIYYLPSDGGAPEQVSSSFDPQTAAVTAGLPHFSTYVAGEPEWVVTLADGANHTVTVVMSGADLTVVVDGGAPDFGPATFGTLRIVGGDMADSVTIDFSGGAILAPIVFDGNGGADTLTGPGVDSVWTFSGINGGALRLDRRWRCHVLGHREPGRR